MKKMNLNLLDSKLRNPMHFALMATVLLTGSKIFAQESGFNNFLLRSPSIVSPSQNYQVKLGRFEGYLGSVNGSVDPKPAGIDDVDVTGLEIGAAGYYAINPTVVLGVGVNHLNRENDDLKSNTTEISPSVAFSITPMFSLGLEANLVNGTQDNVGGGDSDTSFNYYTIGATIHQDLLEATLVFNTENEEDNKPQNNKAQSFGIHGRYRIMPTLALGLSLFQRDSSSVAPAVAKAEDETGFGLHLESQFTDLVSGEFAFLSTTDVDGASGDDQTEFVAMGQYRVNPTLDLGARLSYLTISGSNADSTVVRPGVFLTSYF